MYENGKRRGMKIQVCTYIRSKPEMQGVRTPSPMTMEVPSTVANKRRNLANVLFSSLDLSLDALSSLVLGSSNRKLETSLSSACWLGIIPTLAYRHIREYKANVPPAETILLFMINFHWFPAITRRYIWSRTGRKDWIKGKFINEVLMSACITDDHSLLASDQRDELSPSPLSVAFNTMKTYLMRGMRVRV